MNSERTAEQLDAAERYLQREGWSAEGVNAGLTFGRSTAPCLEDALHAVGAGPGAYRTLHRRFGKAPWKWNSTAGSGQAVRRELRGEAARLRQGMRPQPVTATKPKRDKTKATQHPGRVQRPLCITTPVTPPPEEGRPVRCTDHCPTPKSAGAGLLWLLGVLMLVGGTGGALVAAAESLSAVLEVGLTVAGCAAAAFVLAVLGFVGWTVIGEKRADVVEARWRRGDFADPQRTALPARQLVARPIRVPSERVDAIEPAPPLDIADLPWARPAVDLDALEVRDG